MDRETKDIIKGLTENLAEVLAKQSLILQLLSVKLSGLSEGEAQWLQVSAQENERSVQALRHTLETWK